VLQGVAMCCRVLQGVAVCCSVLQCVTESLIGDFKVSSRRVLQGVAVCCSMLQCVAVCQRESHRRFQSVKSYECCRVLHGVAGCCSVLLCAAVCCSVLQCVTESLIGDFSL